MAMQIIFMIGPFHVGKSLAHLFPLNLYSYLKWVTTSPHNQWGSGVKEVGCLSVEGDVGVISY